MISINKTNVNSANNANGANNASGGAPLVSIVIPAFNKWEYTWKCLMAVAQNTRDVPHEVIVIDNASSDDTAQALQLLENIRFHRNPQNLGFAKASNQGAAMARGKYILFLNNDTEPRPGWLSTMVKFVEAEPAIAIVGSKLLFPDGTLQHGGVVFAYAGPMPVTPFHLHYRRPPEMADTTLSMRAVTAACMLIRPEVFRAVGGFDEGYVNGYEDVDLCLKVWSTGAKIVFAHESVVVHHESVSDGRFTCESANVDRLNRAWMAKFNAFDVDLRRDAKPAVIDPRRLGISVVVPMRDAIWTLGPCLENLRFTTGRQDEIIIVDDGSSGASREFAALFAARNPERVRLLRNDVPVGLPLAARQGLEAATKPLVALVAPSLRVVGDWAARLSAHLDAGSGARVGALTVTLLPIERVPVNELLYPVGKLAPDCAQEPRLAPGDVEPVRFPLIAFTFAERERLLALARRAPETFFGDDQERLAIELAAEGLTLARAKDVGICKLAQIPGDSEAELCTSYVAQSSANLGYEGRYRARGGPSIGEATAAQTELASLIVVAHDNLAATSDCLESIYAGTHRSFEVVLVDNGSREELGALAARLEARHGNLTYIRNARNEGYTRACNQGLAAARGDYVALLHNDVIVTSGWLARLMAVMAIDPSVALAGPALSGGGGVQAVGMRTYTDPSQLPAFAEHWAANHSAEIAVFAPLSGACLLMRRQVVRRLGGLDAAFANGIHATDDYCVRAFRAGFRMAIAFDAFVHHPGGATFKKLGVDRKLAAGEAWEIFCAKWGVTTEAAKSEPREGVVRQLASAAPFDPARDFIQLPLALPLPDEGAVKLQSFG